MKSLAGVFTLLLLALFFSGCKSDSGPEILNAKIIDYRVEYIDQVAGSVPTNILPRRMTLIFADGKALNTIEGFFGQFSLSFMADLEEKTVVTMLKVFDKHYFHKGNVDELPVGISGMRGMQLEKTNETDTILGFSAEKYLLRLPDGQISSIWGTKDLEVTDANITTPYRELDLVLLQFYTELSVLKMLVKANKFEETTISSSAFQIPEGYHRISRASMDKVLTELFK